jgi:hypothetical protein
MTNKPEIKIYNSLFSKDKLARNSGYPLYDNNNNQRSLEFKQMSKPITNIDKFDPIIQNYKKLDINSINNKMEEPIFPESCSQKIPNKVNTTMKQQHHHLPLPTLNKSTSINLESSSNSLNECDSDERSEYEKVIIENEYEKNKDTIIYDSDYDDSNKTEVDLLKTRFTDKQLIPNKRPRQGKYIDPDTDSSSGSEFKNNSPEGQIIINKEKEPDDIEDLFLKGELDIEEEYDDDDEPLSFREEFDLLVKKIADIIDINQHYIPWSNKHLGNGFFSAKTRTVLNNQSILLSKLMALQIKCKGKNEWSKTNNKYNEILLTLPLIKYDIKEDSNGNKYREKNEESITNRENSLNQKMRDLEKGYKEKSNKDKSNKNKNYHDIFKIIDEIYLESQFNDENYGYSLKDIIEKTEKTVNPDEFTIGPFVEMIMDLFYAPNTIIKDFSETDLAIFTDNKLIPYCIFTGKKINLGDSVKQIRVIKNDPERSKDWGIDKFPNRPYTKEILLNSLRFFYVLNNVTITPADYNIFKLTCNSLINLTLKQVIPPKMDLKSKPTRKKTIEIENPPPNTDKNKKKPPTKKQSKIDKEEEEEFKKKKVSKKRKSDEEESQLPLPKNNNNKKPKTNNNNKNNMSLGWLLDTVNEESSDISENGEENKMDLEYSQKLSINIVHKPYIIKYSDHYYLHITPLWNKLNLMNSLVVNRDRKSKNPYSTIDFKSIVDPTTCSQNFYNYANKLKKNEFVKSTIQIILTGVFELFNLLFIRINEPLTKYKSPLKDKVDLVKKQYNIDFNESPLIIDYFFEQLGAQLKTSKISYITKYIDGESHELKENLLDIPFIKIHGNLVLDLFDYLFPPFCCNIK